jgi:cell division protein FtsW (lipid II flippase)
MLVILGVVMISSVSVYPSFKITSLQVARGLLDEPNNSYYLSKNFVHVAISFIALVFFTKLSYTILEKYHRVILLGVYILMGLVLIIGIELNGAK